MSIATRWTDEALAVLREKGLGAKVSRCIDCGAVSLAPTEPCTVDGEPATLFVSDGICEECHSVREAAMAKHDAAMGTVPL